MPGDPPGGTHADPHGSHGVARAERQPAEAVIHVDVPDGVEVRLVDGGMQKIEDAGDGGYGLFATKDFAKGTVVYAYPSEEWPKAAGAAPGAGAYAQAVDVHCTHTDGAWGTVVIRCTPNEHGELYKDGSVEISGFDAMCNHSCDANMVYDEENSVTIATKDIRAGDHLTINYCATNWDESSNLLAFDCNCGSPACVGRVVGFCQLTVAMQWHLFEEGGVSPYTRDKWFESLLESAKDTACTNCATLRRVATVLQSEIGELQIKMATLEDRLDGAGGAADKGERLK